MDFQLINIMSSSIKKYIYWYLFVIYCKIFNRKVLPQLRDELATSGCDLQQKIRGLVSSATEPVNYITLQHDRRSKHLRYYCCVQLKRGVTTWQEGQITKTWRIFVVIYQSELVYVCGKS